MDSGQWARTMDNEDWTVDNEQCRPKECWDLGMQDPFFYNPPPCPQKPYDLKTNYLSEKRCDF